MLSGALSGLGGLSGSLSGTGSVSGGLSKPEAAPVDPYMGAYEFTPSWEEQTAPTVGKRMTANVKVLEIQTYETSNQYGTTFII